MTMAGRACSEKFFERALGCIPGGVNSPVRSCRAVGATPPFIVSGKGDRIVDADGNEYVDYVCSWGASILGHAPEAVVSAVADAARGGLTFGAPTPREVELAELLRELVPCVEKSRMVNSGTEAVMSALRAARAFTGRDKILKFDGCYHGHSDAMLVRAGSGALSGSMPDSAGVTRGAAADTLVAPYNDIHAVEEIFAKSGKEIAAVIVEPVAANMGVVPPAEGFLAFLREITRESGALLVFDEVITGFRLAPGGAQEYFGIVPDLATFGKIAGGGLPAAAFGGRADVMDVLAPDGPAYQAGTLAGNPLATAAALATLKSLKADTGIYARLDGKARRLAEAMRAAAGDAASVAQIGSLIGISFRNEPRETYARWYSHILGRGVYVAPSPFEAMFVSDAHTDEDIGLSAKIMAEGIAENVRP